MEFSNEKGQETSEGKSNSCKLANFEAVADKLLPDAYDELRSLAARLLRRDRESEIRTTSLIHEVYLRLSKNGAVGCTDRVHFFALASNAMRRILVDHARQRRSLRHGGGWKEIQLEEIVIRTNRPDEDLLAVNSALESLAKFDSFKSKIAEIRFFAGMTIHETAEALEVSAATVKREWTLAKAWLVCECSK